VTVATDTPFFPSDLVQRFLAALKRAPSLLVARSGQGVQPAIGLWLVSLADALEASLRRACGRPAPGPNSMARSR
jgi:molybdopterin-guanine dinucleotide biosynthesis protein A